MCAARAFAVRLSLVFALLPGAGCAVGRLADASFDVVRIPTDTAATDDTGGAPDTVAPMDTPPPTDTVMMCPTAQRLCSGTCVNTQTDSQNCGACGTMCAAGQVCMLGTCSVMCAAGETRCGSGGTATCAMTMTDMNNCGACGRMCTAGQMCSMGVCQSTCGAGLTTCSTGGVPGCANLMTDSRNCGACGTACAVGQSCVMGMCRVTCAAGQTLCTGVCVNTATDTANCGACGVACTAGQTCTAGMCRTTCVAPTTLCGAVCVNTSIDAANCGTCGNACAAGTACTAGMCAAAGIRYVESTIARAWPNACTMVGMTRFVTGPVDDTTGTAALPFSFRFYGTAYSSVWASSNGAVGFGAASAVYSNVCLPATTFPNSILAFWDDLYVTTGMYVCGAVSGAAPNRQYTVTWQGVYPLGDTGNMNFSVILYETTGLIDLVYGTMTTGVAARATGTSATIGVQGATATQFTQHSCNTAGVTSSMARRFTPM